MKNIFLFSFILFFHYSLTSQPFLCKEKAEYFIQNDNKKESLSFLDSLALEGEGDFESSILSFLDCISFKKKEYKLKALFLKKVLSWTEEFRTDYIVNKAFFYDKMGNFFFEVDDVNNSVNALKKAENYVKRKTKIDSSLLIQIYFHTANILITKGDLKKAELYLFKALSMLDNESISAQKVKVEILTQLSEVLLQEGDFVEAEKNILLSLDINTTLVGEEKQEVHLLTKLAHLYRAKGESFRAVEYLERAVKIAKKYFPERLGIYYDEIGICYYYLDQFDNAISFFLKAIKYQKERYGSSHPDVINISIRIATCYSFLGQHEKANKIFLKSLSNLGVDLNNPKKIVDMNSVFIPISLFFKAQNHLFAYQATGEMEELKNAHYWFGICLKVVERINDNIEGESKQFLLSNFYYIFESILETCYLQYEATKDERFIEEALDYAERSRSVLLRDAIKEASAEIMTNVPDSIITRETFFKKALSQVEEQIFNEKKKGENSNEIIQLNGQIFNIQEQRGQFLDWVKVNFPTYYRWKYKRSHISISDVRRILRKDETLVLFFWGDESLFTILITDDVVKFKKQPIGKIQENISHFRSAMTGYLSHPSDSLINNYVVSANELYKLLLKPITDDLDKKVLIAPDGPLEYISFGALLSTSENHGSNWGEYDYLIKEYQFRYTHSVQLLLEHLDDPGKKNNGKILAIAPTFESPNTPISKKWHLGPLFKNKQEAQHISNYFETKILEEGLANKATFVQQASNYAGLHFATHAIANDRDGGYSFIYFSPTKDTTENAEVLYAKDICLMNLDADMVVLSACETAAGENQRGEGIISLGRSFSFAGAKSLITTLWKVDDNTAASLMTDYYRYLSEGKEKDVALRMAQMNIIEQDSKHPIFWAAFVPHGDMSSVAFDAASSWRSLVVFIGLGVFFVALLLLRKKEKA